MLADFAKREDKEQEPEPRLLGEVYEATEREEVWKVQVDGSSSKVGIGINMVVLPLRRKKMMYSIRLNFATSNNKYEAMLAGL